MSDKQIIERFLRLCAEKDWTQAEASEAVGLTQGWASMIYRGAISRLSFRTRNRILGLLKKNNGGNS